jgi:hypothetical protein
MQSSILSEQELRQSAASWKVSELIVNRHGGTSAFLKDGEGKYPVVQLGSVGQRETPTLRGSWNEGCTHLHFGLDQRSASICSAIELLALDAACRCYPSLATQCTWQESAVEGKRRRHPLITSSSGGSTIRLRVRSSAQRSTTSPTSCSSLLTDDKAMRVWALEGEAEPRQIHPQYLRDGDLCWLVCCVSGLFFLPDVWGVTLTLGDVLVCSRPRTFPFRLDPATPSSALESPTEARELPKDPSVLNMSASPSAGEERSPEECSSTEQRKDDVSVPSAVAMSSSADAAAHDDVSTNPLSTVPNSPTASMNDIDKIEEQTRSGSPHEESQAVPSPPQKRRRARGSV